MIYTSRIQKAINLAIKTHELDQKQKRKGKDVPYITHPLSVGLILANTGATEDVVVAGILHDTIEDSVTEHKVTKEMITDMFGQRVSDLVLSVTEQDKSLSWVERKAEALEHIKTFSNDSLLLKSADIISNTSELIADYKIDGEKTFDRFNAPKEKIIHYTRKVIATILECWFESPLRQDLLEIDIELYRVQALDEGHISYIEWNLAYILYEISRVFKSSFMAEKVIELCKRTQSDIGILRKHNDIPAFERSFLADMTAFKAVIKNIEEHSKEDMITFLLMAHIADCLSTFADFQEKMKESEMVSVLKVKSEIDKPFVAFIMNEEDSTFEVHLVNSTDSKYTRVNLLSGAYCGDEDGLLETSKVVREKGELLPKSSIRIDSSDWGELDFVIWYNLDLYKENDSILTMVWFQLEKGGGNYDNEVQLLPVIERVGVYIKLDDRGDGEKIEQIVKHTDMEGKYTKSA